MAMAHSLPPIRGFVNRLFELIMTDLLCSDKLIIVPPLILEISQVRYHGVNWRDAANWGCNTKPNPFGQHYLDGGAC